MLDGQRCDELLSFCQLLVRTPSPSGSEGNIAKLVVNVARTLGYDEIHVDAYGNVILHMYFDSPGKKLLFHSQMDHVNVGKHAEWSFYPYGGQIINKRLYGSGISDQKGALAAMVKAGAYLKEDFGGKNLLRGELIIAAVVQQEKFGGCSSRTISSSLLPDAVIAGESSNLTIVRGQRGRAKIILETLGRTAHSSYPEHGINAAEIMLVALKSLKDNYVTPEDVFLGKGDLVLTGLYTTPLVADKAIPECCTAIFERKVLLRETPQNILAHFTAALGMAPTLKQELYRTSFAINEGQCYTGAPLVSEQFVPAWVEDEKTLFLQIVTEGVRKSGISPVVSAKPGFGTSGCVYAAEQGLPTLIFGPCRQDQPHSVDEYIELDHLFDACRAYYCIAEEFLKSR